MAGASTRHSEITPQLYGILFVELADKACEYGDANLKLAIASVPAIYYPDAMIACPPNYIAEGLIDNPTTIFEVVSESSEFRDWHTKFADYETVESVREYVLIDSRQIEVVVFSRSAAKVDWTMRRYLAGEISLPSTNISLSVERLYARWRAISED